MTKPNRDITAEADIRVGGDLADIPLTGITSRMISDLERKTRQETVALVISKLEEVLEPKTDPRLIRQIIEDVKELIYEY